MKSIAIVVSGVLLSVLIANAQSTHPGADQLSDMKTMRSQEVQDQKGTSKTFKGVTDVDEDPTLIREGKAVYPATALKDSAEGTIVVKLFINKEGLVKRAFIVESTGRKDLNESARAAALEYKFKPGKIDGKPVDTWVTIPFKFFISERLNAGRKPVVRTNVLRVESTNQHKHSVAFTFVYCLGDSHSTKSLVKEEKETPFEMTITDENFTGLIQENSLKGEVKVFLTTFEDGREEGSVECSYLLNVIRVSKDASSASGY